MSLETGCRARRRPGGWRPSWGAGCGGRGAERGLSPLPPPAAPAGGVINRGGKRQPISNSIKSPLVRCELITLIHLEVGFHLQDISTVISTFTTRAGRSEAEEPLDARSREPFPTRGPPARGSPSPTAAAAGCPVTSPPKPASRPSLPAVATGQSLKNTLLLRSSNEWLSRGRSVGWTGPQTCGTGETGDCGDQGTEGAQQKLSGSWGVYPKREG